MARSTVPYKKFSSIFIPTINEMNDKLNDNDFLTTSQGISCDHDSTLRSGILLYISKQKTGHYNGPPEAQT